jgi:hypothetical protein
MDAHTRPGQRRQCRNAFIIKTDGLAQIMKAVAGKSQYHMVVAYGDHTEAFSEFCREQGIGILRS